MSGSAKSMMASLFDRTGEARKGSSPSLLVLDGVVIDMSNPTTITAEQRASSPLVDEYAKMMEAAKPSEPGETIGSAWVNGVRDRLEAAFTSTLTIHVSDLSPEAQAWQPVPTRTSPPLTPERIRAAMDAMGRDDMLA